jgi:hypothetical protein
MVKLFKSIQSLSASLKVTYHLEDKGGRMVLEEYGVDCIPLHRKSVRIIVLYEENHEMLNSV